MTIFLLLGILTASGTIVAPAGVMEAIIIIHTIDEVRHEVQEHGRKSTQRRLR